jgi:hypothetical protein
MSIQRRQVATALAALLTFAAPLTAMAEPVRNVVLVHGAWVDGSGWRSVLNPELERFYYQWAGSHMTVIKGASHSVYQSHAGQVAEVIESAARQFGSDS